MGLTKRLGLLFVLALAAFTASASAAAAAPAWRIDALSNTNVAAPGTLTYVVPIKNVGADTTDGSEFDVTAELPPGFSGLAAFDFNGEFSCPSVAGETTITCSSTAALGRMRRNTLILIASVEPGLSGVRTATFAISGGGAAAATTANTVTISNTPAGFGTHAFDATVAADQAGNPFFQVGGHPYGAGGAVDLNIVDPPSGLPSADPLPLLWPAEPLKDLRVDLPPGFLGNPASAPQCSLTDLSNDPLNINSRPLCSPESQVGTLFLRQNGLELNSIGPVPVFNVAPPPGAPARFGFAVLGSTVLLDVKVRSGGDYGVSILSRNVPEALAIVGTSLTIWGVPADEDHFLERACTGEPGPFFPDIPTCKSSAPEAPFLRNPTSCQGPTTTALSVDSWFHPEVSVKKTFTSHSGRGYPFPEESWGPPQGPEGCAKVHFNPQIEAAPTTDAADSPSGLDFHLSVPQDCWEHVEEVCQSDLRDAAVTLPQGMTINPAAASGLGACTEAQVGYKPGTAAPFEFSDEPASCPADSKIGTVEITTPLLGRFDQEGKPVRDGTGSVVPDPLKGSVYLAKQGGNPFGSLLAMYLVAEGSGIVVKQAGEIVPGPGGRLTTRFANAPQQPFSDLHVNLFGGPRAALRTPPTCGSYGVSSTLTPWSGNGAVTRGASFEIDKCPNSGFDPKLTAGTQNPLAGSFSPFTLRLTREDGTQEIAGLGVTLPQGLIGAPKGIAYCPDSVLATFPVETVLGTGAAQEASPSCPAASRVGTVTVGAGAGPEPFYTSSGRAYLAGPYKGAPLSLAVVAPAVAGPFDLGTVLVRNAIHVDPETTQISVTSDPLPTALHGIPLDLRDVRVDLGRQDFTLNPTSCDPAAVTSTVTSAQGATANPSSRFQVAGCDRLGFKPKLGLKLKGDTKRSGHPALTAVLRARKGDANIGRVQVALPHSEFLAQAHIKTICTRVQFAADACPAGSVYGKVTATSPLVDYPLTGNVYLRSSANPLPDMVLALHGPASQPIEVDAVGRIDSVNGGIRTTFATVPDAPLTKVVLRLPGGKKSLLENSTNICRSVNKASVQMDAHNGKLADFTAPLKAKCPRTTKGAKHRRSGR